MTGGKQLITALLILALTASSAYLASSLNSLTFKVSPGHAPTQDLARIGKFGTFYLQMLIGSDSTQLAPESAGTFLPAAGDGVSISSTNSSVSVSIIGVTNSSGLFEEKLSPAKYSVSLSDKRFHLRVHVDVYNGVETRLTVSVRAVLHELRFEEVTSSLPQVVTTKLSLFVAMRSSEFFAKVGDTVFLQNSESFLPDQTLASGGSQQIPALVLNEKLAQNVLWMRLLVLQQVSLAQLRNVGVVTYDPSYVIAIYGHEPNVYGR